MTTKVDFTDPWALLARFQPNDTEDVYHVYRPFVEKLTVLSKLVQKDENDSVLPVPVNAKIFGQILQLMNEPFCGVVQNCSPQEQIDLVIGLHKLGVGTDTGFFDFAPVADQIYESYISKGIKFEHFQKIAERHNLDMYDPVGSVKTLKVMIPLLEKAVKGELNK